MVNPMVQENGFYSIYILVQKKDGTFHAILDLRELNWFVKAIHYLILRLSDVVYAVQPQDWINPLYLCGYFHFHIFPRTCISGGLKFLRAEISLS